MDPVVVDGSRGEGGGQIIRTALALSCITGRPVSLRNIRYNRRIPGLRPQHLAAARILRQMCDGTMKGDRAGSETLEFVPGRMRNSVISADVGTAGSIPLVLQAAVPAAWVAGVRLDLAITGGTDVRWAPTADYIRLVMGAAYARMGARLSVDVQKRGYYPRGGGRIRARVGVGDVIPAKLDAEPEGGTSVICTRWKADAEDGAAAIAEELEREGHPCTLEVREQEAPSQGAAVLAYRTGPGFATGADSLYADGFGSDVARRLLDCASVDENLADMLVVPASVADGLSIFEVRRTTKHLETALYVASLMTGCRYGISNTKGGIQVRIQGSRAA